jgi:hypothetical protein
MSARSRFRSPGDRRCGMVSPRLAKRDRSYRPLPTNAALYLLALVTRRLTLPGTTSVDGFADLRRRREDGVALPY